MKKGSIAFNGKALIGDGKKPLRHGVTEIPERNPNGVWLKPVEELCVSVTPW